MILMRWQCVVKVRCFIRGRKDGNLSGSVFRYSSASKKKIRTAQLFLVFVIPDNVEIDTKYIEY